HPAAGAPPADLVVRGAVIHTAADQPGDLRFTRALPSAMAVRGGRIVALGGERAVAKLVGPRTQVLDLHGLTVLPGLVDSHAHLGGLGNLLAEVNVTGTASYEAVIESVRTRAARTPAGVWICGRGWDQNDWAEKSFPQYAALSAAVPDHPVAIRRVDGHAVLVNARALELARITRDTPDPAGGEIVRDGQGEPTGVLVDNAEDLVDAVIPPLAPAEREERLLAALREAAQHGLTLVHDAGIGREQLAAYRALLSRGTFPIRVHAMASATDSLLEDVLARGPETGDRFSLRAVKVVADGALGSRGALLSADYSDQPGHRGLETCPYDSLVRVAERARARGFQVRVHAIGDLANTRTLDAFERAFEGHPHPELRWAIEHAQVVRPEDVRRFARLGVVASMQATHATSDGPWAERRLGPGRIGWSYAWRRFLDAGVRFADGSDFPIESVNPLLGLYAAITRRDLAGELPEPGWRPGERLTPDEALKSFSLWGAWLAFREDDLGSLEVGKLADFIVVDRDVIAGPASEIPHAKVLRTVVGGETVYEAER
ncbi:MAG: amidohydrolase, partial [Candidatus Eisenbacteria bacterium]|nr:amidohydrolase [Candidatus Eisenbacteria bacterium]